MYRPERWRDLSVGIAAIAAIVIVTSVILVFGRLGRLSGETYRVYVRADEARGIIKGSEVWLSGQKVGAVRDIGFLPPATAATRRVLLEVELMERYSEAIRHDSDVEIRSGGSLIGAPVVYLTAGTMQATILEEGDTLVASDPMDLESIAARYADASKELPGIMQDAKTVFALLKSPEGTAGAVMTEGGGAEATELRGRMSELAGSLRNDRGTLGLAMSGRGALVGRARAAMARADSIKQLIGSNRTSLGRFRRDSTLAEHVAEIRDELSIVGALLEEPRGTAGRLARDSAIIVGVADVRQEMTVLLADVKRRPFRYLGF